MALSVKKNILPFTGTANLPLLTQAYLNRDAEIEELYRYRPELKSITKAIKDRSFPTSKRILLTETFKKQYAGLKTHPSVKLHIEKLLLNNTFTITTAHQPCLCCGPLYVIYKILNAIKTAQYLNEHLPTYNFIPVYFIGGEDHDFEEINHVNLFKEKWTWNTESGNACGRINTDSLSGLITQLSGRLGDEVNASKLKEMLSQSYLKNRTLAESTRVFINQLFGKYGLLILDGDDKSLKKVFAPVALEELENRPTVKLVNAMIGKFKHQFKLQVKPRTINLFYLTDIKRCRIELQNNEYKLTGSDQIFNKSQIKEMLDKHPENFSPNVILRTLYQEMILPNLAYIGGPSEIAYWLQFKSVFDHFHLDYPVLLLRNSIQWIDKRSSERLTQMHVNADNILSSVEEWIALFIKNQNPGEVSLNNEKEELQKIMKKIIFKAKTADHSLEQSGEALQKKVMNQIDVFENKIKKSLKNKHKTKIESIRALNIKLFPDGKLQERTDNFIPFYLKYGDLFFDTILDNMEPLGGKLIFLTEK